MTKAEQIIEYLLARGMKEQTSPSKRYRLFVKGNTKYWVGKSGGVRAGQTVGKSFSVTDSVVLRVKLFQMGGKK